MHEFLCYSRKENPALPHSMVMHLDVPSVHTASVKTICNLADGDENDYHNIAKNMKFQVWASLPSERVRSHYCFPLWCSSPNMLSCTLKFHPHQPDSKKNPKLAVWTEWLKWISTFITMLWGRPGNSLFSWWGSLKYKKIVFCWCFFKINSSTGQCG